MEEAVWPGTAGSCRILGWLLWVTQQEGRASILSYSHKELHYANNYVSLRGPGGNALPEIPLFQSWETLSKGSSPAGPGLWTYRNSGNNKQLLFKVTHFVVFCYER